MRRATRLALPWLARARRISIHALHEESDRRSRADAQWVLISIHALHEESDGHGWNMLPGSNISIHALHEESDQLPQVHE